MRRVSLVVLLLLTGAPPAVPQPLDTWLVFVDDLHIPFMMTGQLRGMLRAFTAELLHEGAMYALYTNGASAVEVDFTADRTLLTSSIKRLTANGLRPDDVAAIQATNETPNELTYRRRIAIDSLVDRFRHVTDRHGPPGSFLLFSSGYFDDSEYREQLHARLRTVLRSDTNVFVIDPRQPEGTIIERLAAGRVTVTP
jgi:hypothetical protein